MDNRFNQMNITLLEKSNLVNISISSPNYFHTEVDIDEWKHDIKNKKYRDFESAPETFKFKDRNWNIILGWEYYDKSTAAKKDKKDY